MARREGGRHVDGVLGALACGTSRSLAVDGDDVERRLGRRAHSGHEVAPERLGVERGENIAEVVVARRAVGEWQKAAHESQLLLTEPREIGETFSARQQGEQQNLIKPVGHLSRLPMIGPTSEVTQENSRLEIRRRPRASLLDRPAPLSVSPDKD